MIRIPKFATIFKGKPKRDEAELDELLETIAQFNIDGESSSRKIHPGTRAIK